MPMHRSPFTDGQSVTIRGRLRDMVGGSILWSLALSCLLLFGFTPPASAQEAEFPSREYLSAMKNQSESSSCGYTLGVGGHGSVWGGHCNWAALTLESGSGLNIRPFSRLNVGRLADASEGLFDPVWYNGVHFIWRLPIQAGLFRIYMGGGPWVGYRPSPDNETTKCYLAHKPCEHMDKTLAITGGGFSGIEFFLRGRSYFLEIGAQGAANPNKMVPGNQAVGCRVLDLPRAEPTSY